MWSASADHAQNAVSADHAQSAENALKGAHATDRNKTG